MLDCELYEKLSPARLFRLCEACLEYLAEQMGLEPTASGVTGRRYNHLNYCSVSVVAVQNLSLWPPHEALYLKVPSIC